jgi:hypothetical protein
MKRPLERMLCGVLLLAGLTLLAATSAHAQTAGA